MEVLVFVISRGDRLRGVHAGGIADGSLVGIAVVGIHELAVDVELQVVVEERRVQSDTGRGTLEVGGLQDTVLVGVAHAHAVGHVLQATLYGHVVVVRYGTVEDLFLPVGIGVAQQACGVRYLTIVVLDELAVLVGTENVNLAVFH